MPNHRDQVAAFDVLGSLGEHRVAGSLGKIDEIGSFREELGP